MSWHLFDERGERAQKIMLTTDGAILGHTNSVELLASDRVINAWGFVPLRRWVPTFIACKMAKGYRVYRPQTPHMTGLEYIEDCYLHNWWQCAAPDHKRLPSMAAVEMWIRHKAMAHD